MWPPEPARATLRFYKQVYTYKQQREQTSTPQVLGVQHQPGGLRVVCAGPPSGRRHNTQR
ncbi:hypothetical protein E2C01_019311 [Portunus trituberculatus]|uniref:Uncharacterized protein n=1 Tax=Portunus trituberculatus TaxID=210409 RepID=A0A5B7DXJ6_PORTR|nr:hypothetical protein [Portunus trituberculatus]